MAENPNPSPESVARQFNDAINAGAVDRLEALMTDDHTFVDTGGNAVRGRADAVAAWTGFFESFPGYRNGLEQLTCTGDTVVMVGHSVCSVDVLDGPALWTARIRDGRVAEWRVYEDTADNRRRLTGSA